MNVIQDCRITNELAQWSLANIRGLHLGQNKKLSLLEQLVVDVYLSIAHLHYVSDRMIVAQHILNLYGFDKQGFMAHYYISRQSALYSSYNYLSTKDKLMIEIGGHESQSRYKVTTSMFIVIDNDNLINAGYDPDQV